MGDEDEEIIDEEDNTAEYNVERDEATNEIVALHVHGQFVDDDHPCVVRRYSTVMVQSDPGTPKYLCYVRNFVETEDDIQIQLCWFYRTYDIRKSGHPLPKDTLVRKACLEGVAGGGDKGTFKEIFLSNHQDTVSCASIMHTVKVWCLPDDDLSPVLIPQDLTAVCIGSATTATTSAASRGDAPSGSAASASTAAAAAAVRGALIPGFVCRRLFHVQREDFTPLGRVAAVRSREEAWLVEETAELLRRSAEELAAFLVQFRLRTEARLAVLARLEQEQQQQEQQGQGHQEQLLQQQGSGAGPGTSGKRGRYAE